MTSETELVVQRAEKLHKCHKIIILLICKLRIHYIRKDYRFNLRLIGFYFLSKVYFIFDTRSNHALWPVVYSIEFLDELWLKPAHKFNHRH